MIKNVVLDMGNVLLNYDPQIPLNLYCDCQEAKDIIQKELFESQQWIEADMGLLKKDELFPAVRNRVPEKYWTQLKDCCEKWSVCMTELPGAGEFCKFLKTKGYKIYVLSNAADSFYDYFPRFLPLDFFDGVVVSADIHVIKPNAEIYEALLNQYRLIPEECLFLDDRQDNVEGAVAVGMQAYIFTGDFEEVKEKYKL